MFGIGETELIIIVLFGFLLFGPDKLPGMGRTIGRVLRQFREASEGFTEVVQTNIVDPATQELNNTGSTKRTPAAAQEPDEEDSDIEDAGEGATAPKRETFAERKARLAAERKAREEAAAASEAAQAPDADDADMPDEGAEPTSQASPAPVADTAGTQEDAPETGKASGSQPTVADLYARGSRRSSRAKAEDESRDAERTETGEGEGNAEA